MWRYRTSHQASYAHDPYAYTLACFPWGEGELKSSTGPRAWQKDILTTIRDHLKNPETRYVPLRIAIASGHGIGKSSPELAKWYRLAIDSDMWMVKATSITAKDPGSEKTWRTDLIPWSENNAEAFAGLHNKERIIVLIFDEASGIADIIWDTAQGALTDEQTIIIWLAFGNPTLPTGRFAECFGNKAGYLRDPKTVLGHDLGRLPLEWPHIPHGVDLPIKKSAVVEVYYTHTNNSKPPNTQTSALGPQLSLHFPWKK